MSSFRSGSRTNATRALVVSALVAVIGLPVAAAAAPGGQGGASGGSGQGSSQAGTATSNAAVPVCLPPQAGFASCDAVRLTAPNAWQGQNPAPARGGPGPGSTTPAGYGAAALQSAYEQGTAPTNVKTVAIVDAYSDPNVAPDLAVYRSQEGLPVLCSVQIIGGTTTTNTSGSCGGSLTVVGASSPGNTGWGEEISLDVDMVSAACPNCNIVLEEAASSTFANLGAAVNDAVSRGAVAVSNSYGGSEGSTESTLDHYYTHSGVAVTVSSGDNGYGVEYPAASPDVIAVGGTHLTFSSTGSPTETVWSGAGSGCSKYESAQTWQPLTSLCSNRTVADVAADADPYTGVAVYDSYGESGWLVFGGTSVASPIVASIAALAGISMAGPLYGDTNLAQVVSGSNSRRCSTYLCNAADSLPSTGTVYLKGSPTVAGYNGPTGNGTPRGTASF